MSRNKRIPRSVLAEAVKKAGLGDADAIRNVLGNIWSYIGMENLSYGRGGLRPDLYKIATSLHGKGFHYSPHKRCNELTAADFVECWSGSVNNPTVRRHKVGNCKVKV